MDRKNDRENNRTIDRTIDRTTDRTTDRYVSGCWRGGIKKIRRVYKRLRHIFLIRITGRWIIHNRKVNLVNSDLKLQASDTQTSLSCPPHHRSLCTARFSSTSTAAMCENIAYLTTVIPTKLHPTIQKRLWTDIFYVCECPQLTPCLRCFLLPENRHKALSFGTTPLLMLS